MSKASSITIRVAAPVIALTMLAFSVYARSKKRAEPPAETPSQRDVLWSGSKSDSGPILVGKAAAAPAPNASQPATSQPNEDRRIEFLSGSKSFSLVGVPGHTTRYQAVVTTNDNLFVSTTAATSSGPYPVPDQLLEYH